MFSCASTGDMCESFSDAGEETFGPLKNLIVWVKTHGGMGSFYRSQHELIFVFKNGDAPHINNFELGQHGRNRVKRLDLRWGQYFSDRSDLTTSRSIPTVKPVALVADAMRDCSRRGDIVLDPFMGSGTTILAAERVGRRAYGLEIDPLYVDVAIRRWQAFTKRDAVLASSGKTFDEVTASARSAHGGRNERRAKRPEAIRDFGSTPYENSDGVGYGKPPSEHTWKPGQSGNPKGRPKGSKNKSTILREIFQRKIESRSERGTEENHDP